MTVAVSEDEIAAVVACYRRGWLTQGPRTKELEAALGTLFECHARAVGTATAALHLALRALGIGPGDEVLVASSVAPATRAVVMMCGAGPVVVDPSATELEQVVSDRSTTLIVDRRRGDDPGTSRRFCDEHGLRLVEEVTGMLDGRRAEVVGDIAVLSFAAPSALALGSGGAVLTGSDSRADLVASWRSHAMTSGTWERHHGREETYDVVDLGYNYRFDEPRAVLALARLAALQASTATR